MTEPFLETRKWRAGRVFNYRTLVVHGMLRRPTTSQDRKVLGLFLQGLKVYPEAALRKLVGIYRGIE